MDGGGGGGGMRLGVILEEGGYLLFSLLAL